jgi:hypothetical protein
MHDGRIIGDAYVEIGPQDADYARLAQQAITMDELERRQAGWAAGDEALRQEFLEFARVIGDRDWPEPGTWPEQATGPGAE